MEVISTIREVIMDLRKEFEDIRDEATFRGAIKKIDNGEKLFPSPPDNGNKRLFLKEGDLVKKCQSGKFVTYRFFLFSDQLLYTHRTYSGDYNVHKQLKLSEMRANPIDDDENRTFHISHPSKSFEVIAHTSEIRRDWLRTIANASQAQR